MPSSRQRRPRSRIENLRSELNVSAEGSPKKPTVGEAWGHFQANELRDSAANRSPSTITGYLDYLKNQILPTWKDLPLGEVKAVNVERWLRSLDLAPGTKAKIRNHMHVLFAHCIRWELYEKANPITSVRQSSIRRVDPAILTVEEMQAIIRRIESLAIRLMVLVAATSAIRRSELRGLQWGDVDLDENLLNLQRGLYGKELTALKTKASKKPVPILPMLAEELKAWREQTPYPRDTDWVFASPFTNGERPYWAESALKDYVRPAAAKAGIRKHVGWHTFRHSVASLLGQNGEDVKVVQELLRHANSRITVEVYQQANHADKRAALTTFSGVFVVPMAKAD